MSQPSETRGGTTSPDPPSRWGTPAQVARLPIILIVSHLAVVTAFIAGLTYMLSQPVVGANIGAGLVILAIAGLGMPWSLLYFLDVMPERDYVATLILITSALVNVILHGAIALFVSRRR